MKIDVEQPARSIEPRKASLKVSAFVGLIVDGGCPEWDGQDVRITSKYSIRYFSRVLAMVAREWDWSYTYLCRALTWQAWKNRERSDEVLKLKKLHKDADRVIVKYNDRRIDALLQPKAAFTPRDMDTGYTTIRVLNQEVKEGLHGQAKVCEIALGTYVQVCIVEHLLRQYGQSASGTFGKTAQVWQEAVDDFDRWLRFQIYRLSWCLSGYLEQIPIDR